MKKTLLLFALALYTTVVNAQTSEDSDFKPQAKSISTELNFNPFKGNLSLNNALNQIKARYFLTQGLALRLGFNISTKDSVMNAGTPYGVQGLYATNERKSNTLGLNFGIEKHFKGTKRLSPYIGFDLSISKRSASHEIVSNAYTVSVKNGWVDLVLNSGGSPYISRVLENSYSQYGATAVAGFDFYMAKNFFLGYEFNLSYVKTSYETPEIAITGPQITNPNYISNNSSSALGTSLVNGIRIGYSF